MRGGEGAGRRRAWTSSSWRPLPSKEDELVIGHVAVKGMEEPQMISTTMDDLSANVDSDEEFSDEEQRVYDLAAWWMHTGYEGYNFMFTEPVIRCHVRGLELMKLLLLFGLYWLLFSPSGYGDHRDAGHTWRGLSFAWAVPFVMAVIVAMKIRGEYSFVQYWNMSDWHQFEIILVVLQCILTFADIIISTGMMTSFEECHTTHSCSRPINLVLVPIILIAWTKRLRKVVDLALDVTGLMLPYLVWFCTVVWLCGCLMHAFFHNISIDTDGANYGALGKSKGANGTFDTIGAFPLTTYTASWPVAYGFFTGDNMPMIMISSWNQMTSTSSWDMMTIKVLLFWIPGSLFGFVLLNALLGIVMATYTGLVSRYETAEAEDMLQGRTLAFKLLTAFYGQDRISYRHFIHLLRTYHIFCKKRRARFCCLQPLTKYQLTVANEPITVDRLELGAALAWDKFMQGTEGDGRKTQREREQLSFEQFAMLSDIFDDELEEYVQDTSRHSVTMANSATVLLLVTVAATLALQIQNDVCAGSTKLAELDGCQCNLEGAVVMLILWVLQGVEIVVRFWLSGTNTSQRLHNYDTNLVNLMDALLFLCNLINFPVLIFMDNTNTANDVNHRVTQFGPSGQYCTKLASTFLLFRMLGFARLSLYQPGTLFHALDNKVFQSEIEDRLKLHKGCWAEGSTYDGEMRSHIKSVRPKLYREHIVYFNMSVRRMKTLGMTIFWGIVAIMLLAWWFAILAVLIFSRHNWSTYDGDTDCMTDAYKKYTKGFPIAGTSDKTLSEENFTGVLQAFVIFFSILFGLDWTNMMFACSAYYLDPGDTITWRYVGTNLFFLIYHAFSNIIWGNIIAALIIGVVTAEEKGLIDVAVDELRQHRDSQIQQKKEGVEAWRNDHPKISTLMSDEQVKHAIKWEAKAKGFDHILVCESKWGNELRKITFKSQDGSSIHFVPAGIHSSLEGNISTQRLQGGLQGGSGRITGALDKGLIGINDASKWADVQLKKHAGNKTSAELVQRLFIDHQVQPNPTRALTSVEDRCVKYLQSTDIPREHYDRAIECIQKVIDGGESDYLDIFGISESEDFTMLCNDIRANNNTGDSADVKRMGMEKSTSTQQRQQERSGSCDFTQGRRIVLEV